MSRLRVNPKVPWPTPGNRSGGRCSSHSYSEPTPAVHSPSGNLVVTRPKTSTALRDPGWLTRHV